MPERILMFVLCVMLTNLIIYLMYSSWFGKILPNEVSPEILGQNNYRVHLFGSKPWGPNHYEVKHETEKQIGLFNVTNLVVIKEDSEELKDFLELLYTESVVNS